MTEAQGTLQDLIDISVIESKNNGLTLRKEKRKYGSQQEERPDIRMTN